MHVKRFEAPTLELALAEVKQVFGPDALILSTRTIEKGRDKFGLFSRSVVEVQAARERAGEAFALNDGHSFSSTPEVPFRDPDHSSPSRFESSRSDFEAEMRAELRALRREMAALSAPREAKEAGRVDESSVEFLVRGGLDMSVAERVVAAWRSTREEGEGDGAAVTLLDYLHARLESKCVPPRESDRPRLRLVVGAPGVGKTTSLAKLAARNEEGEREVALVSFDHYRVGAPDQLRRYAELLDSPFAEIAESSAVAELPARFRHHEILVDTTGRSGDGEERLASLAPLRERMGRELEVELVLDATTRHEVQRAQIGRFAHLEPNRLIVTKTDECENLASLANLLLDPLCPALCWRGSGQRVPEDFEMIEAGRIVRDLMRSAA